MRQGLLFFGMAVVGMLVTTILCNGRTIPKSVRAVEDFDGHRYLGTWYEIARLDFRFERNLNNTTAHYSMNDDGTIKVVNRGYNYKSGKWRQATGKAKFVSSSDEAKLEVSFFGPFYSGYNVIAIDKDYKYALVAGKSRQYLWFLSREKTMPEPIKQAYLKKAEGLGFRTSELVWVEHSQPEAIAVAP